MMHRAKLLATGLATLTLIGSAGAQPPPPTTTTTTATTTTQARRASEIMNASVVLQGGAAVGKVIDFVIDDGGYVEYLVVDANNQYLLLPFQSIRLDGGRRLVQLNVTREKFREIPTFTGNNWPLTDQQYIRKVRTVFGVTESGYRGDRRPLNRPDGPADDHRDPLSPRALERRDTENPNPARPPAPNTNPPAPRPTDRPPPPPPPAPTPPPPRPPEPNRNPPPA